MFPFDLVFVTRLIVIVLCTILMVKAMGGIHAIGRDQAGRETGKPNSPLSNIMGCFFATLLVVCVISWASLDMIQASVPGIGTQAVYLISNAVAGVMTASVLGWTIHCRRKGKNVWGRPNKHAHKNPAPAE